MELISHRNVARFLDGCDAYGVHIVGVEGFRVLGAMIQPDMNAILDCSSASEAHATRVAARRFIDAMAGAELAYEFDLLEADDN